MIQPSSPIRRPGRRPALALAPALLALLGACGSESSSAAAESATSETGLLTVATVNYPLAYLAERIGAGAVEVRFPREWIPPTGRPRPRTSPPSNRRT